jgi:hypothetical protein
LIAGRWSLLEDGTGIICIKSIVNDVCPPRKSHVRGCISLGGYVVEQNPTNRLQCFVTVVGITDLAGQIPQRLKRMVAAKHPAIVSKFDNYVVKLFGRQQKEFSKVDVSKFLTSPHAFQLLGYKQLTPEPDD